MSDTQSTPKNISLALGSGGARGVAHIGVLRWLEAHGYQTREISGTSIGAMVGGVYAAGKLDELEQWARAITRTDMLRLMDVSWRSDGVFKGDRVIEKLRAIVGETNIEALPIPFVAIAADIAAHRERRIESGSLFAAIRASISLPILFTPQRTQQQLMVDGGILNPVPISALTSPEQNIVVAVNLCADPDPSLNIEEVRPVKSDGSALALHHKVTEFFTELSASIKSIGEINWAAYDIINQTIDAIQNNLHQLHLSQHPADVIIDIPSNVAQVMDFHKAKWLIDYGYARTEQAFAQYQTSQIS